MDVNVENRYSTSREIGTGRYSGRTEDNLRDHLGDGSRLNVRFLQLSVLHTLVVAFRRSVNETKSNSYTTSVDDYDDGEGLISLHAQPLL